MKVILPVAGRGTRLMPHTHTKPKCLVQVAGQPVLGHILQRLQVLPIEELILIIDADPDNEARIRAFMTAVSPVPVTYVQQLSLNGPAHAVFLAHERIDGELFIVFNDTIFDADLTRIAQTAADGVIWVKEVGDPRRFGLVVMEGERIQAMVEKPEVPPSNLAMIGMYYIKDGPALMQRIGHIIQQNKTVKGEFYLPDPLQLMIDDGYHFTAARVKGWYDCGTIDALLDTNRSLLQQSVQKSVTYHDSVIIPPVYIAEGARIRSSVIGPHVSIASNTDIDHAIIRDSIINQGATIQDTLLHTSLVGENACVKGAFRRLNVGDNSTIADQL